MRFAALLTAVLGTACGASAASIPHDPGLSSMTVVRSQAELVVRVAFANADFAAASAFDSNRDGAMRADELHLPMATWCAWADAHVQVSSDATTMPHACSTVVAQLGEQGDVELLLTFGIPSDAAVVSLPFLESLSHGHRCYASLQDQQQHVMHDALLSANNRCLKLPPATADAGAARGFGQATMFFVLGVEHILIGYDHLAFLLALLAVGVTMRRTIATITAFSLAHSLTLSAATLDWLRLPGPLVESAIAASIVLVAVANISQRNRPAPHRWSWAFAFGLIHGFGFAGVLADLQIGGDQVLVPLLSFNVGVEVGQVACALVALPILWWLARRNARMTTNVLSAVAGLAGIYWLLERLL